MGGIHSSAIDKPEPIPPNEDGSKGDDNRKSRKDDTEILWRAEASHTYHWDTLVGSILTTNRKTKKQQRCYGHVVCLICLGFQVDTTAPIAVRSSEISRIACCQHCSEVLVDYCQKVGPSYLTRNLKSYDCLMCGHSSKSHFGYPCGTCGILAYGPCPPLLTVDLVVDILTAILQWARKVPTPCVVWAPEDPAFLGNIDLVSPTRPSVTKPLPLLIDCETRLLAPVPRYRYWSGKNTHVLSMHSQDMPGSGDSRRAVVEENTVDGIMEAVGEGAGCSGASIFFLDPDEWGVVLLNSRRTLVNREWVRACTLATTALLIEELQTDFSVFDTQASNAGIDETCWKLFSPFNPELLMDVISLELTHLLGEGRYGKVYSVRCGELRLALKVIDLSGSFIQEQVDAEARCIYSYARRKTTLSTQPDETLDTLCAPLSCWVDVESLKLYILMPLSSWSLYDCSKAPQSLLSHPALGALLLQLTKTEDKAAQDRATHLAYRLVVAFIVYQLCKQLRALHSVGVFHGDLHAKNVLLVGDSFRVIITDFGCSENIEVENDDRKVSFASSEIWTGSGSLISSGSSLGHREETRLLASLYKFLLRNWWPLKHSKPQRAILRSSLPLILATTMVATFYRMLLRALREGYPFHLAQTHNHLLSIPPNEYEIVESIMREATLEAMEQSLLTLMRWLATALSNMCSKEILDKLPSELHQILKITSKDLSGP